MIDRKRKKQLRGGRSDRLRERESDREKRKEKKGEKEAERLREVVIDENHLFKQFYL